MLYSVLFLFSKRINSYINKTLINIGFMERYLQGDRWIWIIFGFLAMASILSVYSAAGSMAFKYRGGDTEYYLFQQFIYLSLGALLVFVSSKVNYIWYSKFANISIWIAGIALFYTLFNGTEVNDARRWIMIPWVDKTIQTSDFAKIALILYLAKGISTRQEKIKDFKHGFLPLLIPIIVITGLIAPADLSTAALLFAISLMMLFIGRVQIKYIFAILVFGIVLLGFIFLLGYAFPDFIRSETWVSRINDFLYSPDGKWQIVQSKIAMANGSWFGVGPGNSIQRNYLPYSYADFIYAIVVEEYGLIGAFTVLIMYFMLLVRSTFIVSSFHKAFGAILAFGLTLNIVVQAFANIAVSVHLVPVTGLTLPLVSMGGTSVLLTCISFGIILSVSRKAEIAKRERRALKELEVLDIPV